MSGRCQEQVAESGETITVYRLVKYAIRPVSPSAEYVSRVQRPFNFWLKLYAFQAVPDTALCVYCRRYG